MQVAYNSIVPAYKVSGCWLLQQTIVSYSCHIEILDCVSISGGCRIVAIGGLFPHGIPPSRMGALPVVCVCMCVCVWCGVVCVCGVGGVRIVPPAQQTGIHWLVYIYCYFEWSGVNACALSDHTYHSTQSSSSCRLGTECL